MRNNLPDFGCNERPLALPTGEARNPPFGEMFDTDGFEYSLGFLPITSQCDVLYPIHDRADRRRRGRGDTDHGRDFVAAMLVVPVAAASQVARSFKESLLASVVVAEIVAIVGITFSYSHGVATGGEIVLVAIGIYGTAVVISKMGILGSVMQVLTRQT